MDLGDGHYNDEPNYKWCRENESEPGLITTPEMRT